jgi:4-hydroxy-2-oxoglutarate aldolase
MVRLAGVFGPVVTTFQRGSESLDAASFAANVTAHLAAGLDGVVVCGSTGEAALLSDEERLVLLDAARNATPSEKLVIMGTGAESTKLTIHRCKEAQTAGADAVLVVAPHYYGSSMTDRALRQHYRSVADESPLPVLLYNIPKYMHFRLSAELVDELAHHPNIAGMKDSSGDLDLLRGYLASQSPSFTVLTGNGATFAQALSAGARGGILAVGLFAAAKSLAIYHAHQRGDQTVADALQEKLKPAAVTIVGEMGVAGVKAALDAVGMHGGPVRGPLLDLDAAGVRRVRELLA